MAAAPAVPAVPVCVHGWRVAQAFVGWRRGEREHTGRDRHRVARAPGGDRRHGGHEGGRDQLEQLHHQSDLTRADGRAPGGG